jgi:RimJ/RimL family protein N-acetyltransferase
MTTITPTRPLITAEELYLLKDQHIFLGFLDPSHRETLCRLAKDERIWEYTKTLLLNDSYDEQFDRYFNEAYSITGDGGQCFTIHDASDGNLIGMSRVYNVDREVGKATIGHTWYVPAVWGKVYNKACKLLLLQYLFENLGFNRVDFLVAGQNIRSQKAVMKIGGVREGVLRHFRLRPDGVPSDVHYFSILGTEWPEKKVRLQEMVAASTPF